MKNELNVLFLTEKWCDGNPSLGLSNHYQNLFGSLRCSFPEVKINIIHYDEFYLKYKEKIDSAIEHIFSNSVPDIVFVSFLGDSYVNPSIETFKFLKQRGSKICFFWPDTGYSWALNKINQIGKIADLHISWGGENVAHNYMDRQLWLWAPQNEKMFYNEQEKIISASFIGSINGYKDRKVFLNYALAKNLNVLVLGGQREGKLTPEEYSYYIRKSKIGINFSESPSGFDQMKGRVIEIISCGSMLFEKKNSITSKFLTPNVDYVEFQNLQDFEDKLNYYLNNDEERNKIAFNGYKKYIENYSAKNFWSNIFWRLKYEL